MFGQQKEVLLRPRCMDERLCRKPLLCNKSNGVVMNAEQFNQRMKKVAEYSNKGEMNLVALRVMLYLTNEYEESKNDVVIQSAEAIGANVGGYSYQMVRKGIKELRDMNILIEQKCSFDKRYREYKFNDITQWK
jgi:hypothetical protein